MPNRTPFALLSVVLLLASPVFAADPSPPVAPAADAASQQLADVQEQLATSLRSYSVLMDENSSLKAAADKTAAETAGLNAQLEAARETVAALKVQAAAAAQVQTLRNQLRQLQDQMGVLSAENARLKLRLALAGPPPSGGLSVPTRPQN